MIVLDVARGVTLTLALPADTPAEAASAQPAIDVSAVPGARVVLQRGFALAAGATVRAACVMAPSARWAPGIEELVLGRATGLATAGLASAPGRITVERWEAGGLARVEERFEQRLSGRAGGREVAAIQHVLGFVGDDHEVVVCSVGCAAGGADPARAEGCGAVVGGTTVRGPFTGLPPPSPLVRGVLFAAEKPYETAAGVGVVAAAVVALVLARRPKVPGRRGFP